MTKRIFRSIILVAMAVFLACLILILGLLYDYYSSVQELQLQTELELGAAGVERSGEEYLVGLADRQKAENATGQKKELTDATGQKKELTDATGQKKELTDVTGQKKELTDAIGPKAELADIRFTWVGADGTVLYDTKTDRSTMENHSLRKEIREALETGSGSDARYSSTLTEQTLYMAKRLEDGTVLRISTSRYTVLALMLSMLQPFFVVLAIAVVLAFVLADRLSRKIVEPLEKINLDKPLEGNSYEELAPMLRKLETQHQQIRTQIRELKEKRNEFDAVTGNLKEGLVLLNNEDKIISMNSAAMSFFGVDWDHEGEDFLILERDITISAMIREAAEQGKAEVDISRGGREYRLSFSCVRDSGISGVMAETLHGVVILIVDITDKVFAERSRKEFTANVSHELKTPLQTILGSSELMKSGLVQPEDVPGFAGRIHDEASRLVTLINDIIYLSRLDEEAELPVEQFDVLELVREELEALEPSADRRDVKLKLEAGDGLMSLLRNWANMKPEQVPAEEQENQDTVEVQGNQTPEDMWEKQETVDVQEIQFPTDVREKQETVGVQEIQFSTDVWEKQETVDVKGNQTPEDMREMQETVEVQEIQFPTDMREKQDTVEVQEIQFPTDVREKQETVVLERDRYLIKESSEASNSADSFCITASRQLVHEIVFNLCDNAIKYNVEGGSVQVKLDVKKTALEDLNFKQARSGIVHGDRELERSKGNLASEGGESAKSRWNLTLEGEETAERRWNLALEGVETAESRWNLALEGVET
ncbi:MAG: hypothetical protein HUJ69_03670, partial [Lachnospiraceae bacterium]|nr:hypothetical protein [Lachnospiraceae bacterium]